MSTAIDFALALALRKKGTERITRASFMYMEAASADARDDFAQCVECRDFVKRKNRCAILGPKKEVLAQDSCGAFIEGKYAGQPIRALVTDEDVGFVNRKVRCEHCAYGGKACKLYQMLNEALPDVFDLDTKIKPKGCCNANTPAGAQT